MSNKTQLQTNNTALDALIARVNAAKDTAASLPEAGGGSGDGGITTCVVTLSLSNGANANFVDQNLQYQTGVTSGTVNVVKHSVIVLNTYSSYGVASGSYVELERVPGYALYLVTGDCSFTHVMGSKPEIM